MIVPKGASRIKLPPCQAIPAVIYWTSERMAFVLQQVGLTTLLSARDKQPDVVGTPIYFARKDDGIELFPALAERSEISVRYTPHDEQL